MNTRNEEMENYKTIIQLYQKEISQSKLKTHNLIQQSDLDDQIKLKTNIKIIINLINAVKYLILICLIKIFYFIKKFLKLNCKLNNIISKLLIIKPLNYI